MLVAMDDIETKIVACTSMINMELDSWISSMTPVLILIGLDCYPRRKEIEMDD